MTKPFFPLRGSRKDFASRLKRKMRNRLLGETLEPRAMLAVTATFSGGNLTITGDNAANAISIATTATNQITVSGDLNQVFNNVTGNITINLKGGADNLQVEPLNAKNLYIDTGAGDSSSDGDSVNLDDVTLSGELQIRTGAGSDSVYLEDDISVAKNVLIDTGSESDNVQWYDSPGVGGSVTILTGAASDSLTLGNIGTIGGTLVIDTGGGDTAASGSDHVNLYGFTVNGAISVKTGAGSDCVSMNYVWAKSSLLIDTGSEGDWVTIGNTTVATDATIFTGSGEDHVLLGVSEKMTPEVEIRLLESQASANFVVNGNLKVDTGSENDCLFIVCTYVGKDANILTGSGSDNATIGLDRRIFDSINYGQCAPATVWASVKVVGYLSVDTGSEGDYLDVASVYVGKDAKFVTGGGNDYANIGLVTKTLEDWESWTYSSANVYVGGSLLIDMGGDNDCLKVYSVYVGVNANIFLGGGADEGDLAYVYVKKAFKLDAGGENDNVSGYDISAADSMAFLLGGGDDMLCLGDCWSKTLSVDGGSGYDKFLEDPSEPNSFGKRTVVGIEYFGSCSFGSHW